MSWDHRLDELLAYPAGYELIPLHAPDALDKNGKAIGKAPFKGWRKDRPLTLDEARQHMAEGSNVGVRLRPLDLVIDVDPRNFLPGDDPFKRLQEDMGIDLSSYPTVETGSGGLHVYMRLAEEALLRDSLEDYQGVEFKSLGRQVVSAGSVHPDAKKPYLWDPLSGMDKQEAPLAPWELVELARRPGRIASVDAGDRTPEQLGEMLEGLDPKQFRDHSAWLEIMMACHHATGGEGRDEFLEWSTSDPKYSRDAWLIGRRWDSLHADQSGRRVTERTLFKRLVQADRADLLPRVGAEEDFAADVDEVQAIEDDAELQAALDAKGGEGDPSVDQLEALNARGYAAVNENGAFRVYRRRKDYTWPEGPRDYWEVQRKGDFLDLLSNLRVQKLKGDTVTVVPLAMEWLRWGNRTSFDGVAFDPGCRIPKEANVLNLWTDWAVEPKKGDWSLLRQLLLEGLCDGDEEMYKYVLDWSAFMVQHPQRPAEVALVFRGQKGTGKGTYFRALGQLAGRHSMHINSQHHFTSHFNAHLRDCIFLFADEAMWAGDKRAEGTLKALITEPTLVVEAKGKDVVVAMNHLHIGMASNEDWVFPASLDDERRLAISDVNTKFRGNTAFFTALNAQMDNGGLAAMLFDLKVRDISDFHPRRSVPQTKALAAQKLQSLDPWDSWWYESLCAGSPCPGREPIVGSWEEGSCAWAADDLRDGLEAHLRRLGVRGSGRRSMDTTMGQRLQKRVPDETLRKVRTRRPEQRVDLEADRSGRVYGYRLPSLDKCRQAFETQLGAVLPWDTEIEEVSEVRDLDADVLDMDIDPLDETWNG